MNESSPNLIQVVYCSAAAPDLTLEDIQELLRVARRHNAKRNITGVLLYAGRSFIQVLEGEKKDIDPLINAIERDKRHRNITVIIREPIAERSFEDWLMGYADLRGDEVEKIIGSNTLLVQNKSLHTIGQGRARKLLDLFKKGHWRARIRNDVVPEGSSCRYRFDSAFPTAVAPKPMMKTDYSFAFQPIVNASSCAIFSYEALIRGKRNESAFEVLRSVHPSERLAFHEESRLLAIQWAAHLGLCTQLNLNIMPSAILNSPTAIPSVLDAAKRFSISPRQIILEILESEIIDSLKGLSTALRKYRSTGLVFAIDDFGAGHAGLNLLAEFQPDFLKLDIRLVRNVEKKGPRQAIIRGIRRTCKDLGIELIAEGVETENEYRWLRDEGIKLFQGYLFARPTIEELPTSFFGPV